MDHSTTVKILTFHSEKCKGCLECEKACSQVHFKTNDGKEKSAIRITKAKNVYHMHVCDQRGLCLDMCVRLVHSPEGKMGLCGLIKTSVSAVKHVSGSVRLAQ